MLRFFFLLYGVAAHVAFLAVFAYMAGFVGNLFVPKTVDSGEPGPVAEALLINVGLLAIFGLQHSVMARSWFKRVWTRFVPEPIERSTYVWISNALLALAMWQWRPIDLVVWDVRTPGLREALHALFAAGWLLIPLASLMIDHLDLFGTRQVWLHFLGRRYTVPAFRTPLLYSWIRHPLYVGWFVAFWATPTMTVGHLLFAGVLTAYILIAVRIEERDLVQLYGEQYESYRRRVPAFIPFLAGGSKPQPAAPGGAAVPAADEA